MSSLIVMFAVGVWAVIGHWVWKNFVRPRIPERRARVAGFAFAAAWFVLPVGDEILGAYEFKRLCEEIPPIRYYGPIAVGPGAFFDEAGNRKWKNSDDFARIQASTREWHEVWELREEESRLARWPMPIFQSRALHTERAAGRLVLESYFRGSGGGWINRTVAGGMLGSYQCRSKGAFPEDYEMIVFAGKAQDKSAR